MKTLILVDLQNDFMPDGALAVAHGDQTVAVANRLMSGFDLVVATQDWHPADHGSFSVSHPGKTPGQVIELNGVSQILWPVHCVQNTHGAAFHKDLNQSNITRVFQKGTAPGVDSYSGFYDNDRALSTGLADYLRALGVKELYIMGLATDYCVKFTALDAVAEGFRTTLVLEGCRGVNLNPSDSEIAVKELLARGVEIA